MIKKQRNKEKSEMSFQWRRHAMFTVERLSPLSWQNTLCFSTGVAHSVVSHSTDAQLHPRWHTLICTNTHMCTNEWIPCLQYTRMNTHTHKRIGYASSQTKQSVCGLASPLWLGQDVLSKFTDCTAALLVLVVHSVPQSALLISVFPLLDPATLIKRQQGLVLCPST